MLPTIKNLIYGVIATRAYELWVTYGKPENRDDAIWLEAELELLTGWKDPLSNRVLPVSD